MIAVLVPTRGRVDLLERCIDSCFATADGDVVVVPRWDVDDRETMRYLQRRAYVVDPAPPIFREQVFPVAGLRMNGYASLPTFYAEAAQVGKLLTDLFFCVNDDAVFRTPGWDTAIARSASMFPDGVFSIATNAVLNRQQRPFHAVSRRWLDALGWIIDPRLFWGDVFVRDVAQALDREIYLEDTVVEHVWAGDRRSEAAAQEAELGTWTPEHVARHAQCVAEAVAKLRPLMAAEVAA